MNIPQIILAFDFGTSFIGVAVGQNITRTATPLPALKARDGIPDWVQIEKLIAEWRPQKLLVGLPLNMDGSESGMSARAKKFAQRLHGRFGLPLEMWDERLSSFEARGELLGQNRHNKSGGKKLPGATFDAAPAATRRVAGRDGGYKKFRERGVDSLSARLILESWFAAGAPASAGS